MTGALTTTEAAAVLGISAAGVRQLVRRERLRPVLLSRPLRFRWLDVERLRVARMSQAERSRLEEMTRRWEAAC